MPRSQLIEADGSGRHFFRKKELTAVDDPSLERSHPDFAAALFAYRALTDAATMEDMCIKFDELQRAGQREGWRVLVNDTYTVAPPPEPPLPLPLHTATSARAFPLGERKRVRAGSLLFSFARSSDSIPPPPSDPVPGHESQDNLYPH
jgi:hypothetical protein